MEQKKVIGICASCIFDQIPLESFIKENGDVWIFDPYGEHGDEEFFSSFMGSPLATFTGEE